MDNLADLIEASELFGAYGGVDGGFVAHRLVYDGTETMISQDCVIALVPSGSKPRPPLIGITRRYTL